MKKIVLGLLFVYGQTAQSAINIDRYKDFIPYTTNALSALWSGTKSLFNNFIKPVSPHFTLPYENPIPTSIPTPLLNATVIAQPSFAAHCFGFINKHPKTIVVYAGVALAYYGIYKYFTRPTNPALAATPEEHFSEDEFSERAITPENIDLLFPFFNSENYEAHFLEELKENIKNGTYIGSMLIKKGTMSIVGVIILKNIGANNTIDLMFLSATEGYENIVAKISKGIVKKLYQRGVYLCYAWIDSATIKPSCQEKQIKLYKQMGFTQVYYSSSYLFRMDLTA